MLSILYIAKVFLIFTEICSSVVGEKWCPEPEDIEPCTCRDVPSTILVCKNMTELDTLIRVFENSRRYTYQEVHLESAIFLYLPQAALAKIDIKELYLENMVFSTLFDFPPTGLNTLYKIQVDKSTFQSTLQWELLQPLKNLRELHFTMDIKIRKDLSENLPINLKKLEFYGATIKKLLPGTFKRLVNLDKLVIDASKLNELSRDAFPAPFNVRILSFNDNKLTKIPEDLFSYMPNLQFLSIKNNQISQIPESAFIGRTQNVPYMMLEGNPLLCDCKLKWIVNDKPEFLSGTCEGPEDISGRALKELHPFDIKC